MSILRALRSRLNVRNSPTTRILFGPLLDEAISSIAARPARSMMTMAGTILGIASFIAIVGLTTTTSGQIESTFNELEATQVVVNDLATKAAGERGDSFPSDVRERIAPLNGVVDAGVYFHVLLSDESSSTTIATTPSSADSSGSSALSVYGAEAGTLIAADAQLASGVLLDSVHTQEKVAVAVLGSAAASALGISSVENNPTVFVGDDAYSVIGILRDIPRLPELTSAVVIPSTVAVERYGLPLPSQPARVLIQTEVGAAPLLAAQAPYALRPDDPSAIGAAAPPDWSGVTENVTSSIHALLLALAAVALFIGCLAITNTMMIAVMERTGEIGLRQALGATPKQIALQFLTESTMIGAVGGVLGNALGIVAVIAVALAQHWTPVLDSRLSVCGLLLGLVTGIGAGLYPAVRAARIEPASALQH